MNDNTDPAVRVGDQIGSGKKLEFKLTIETGLGGDTDHERVEELISLAFNDILYDEVFTDALQAKEYISSTVIRLDKQNG